MEDHWLAKHYSLFYFYNVKLFLNNRVDVMFEKIADRRHCRGSRAKCEQQNWV